MRTQPRSVGIAAAFLATAVLFAAAGSPLMADMRAPDPSMTWDKMLAAELVVVARYEKHAGKSLSLRVDRVLKGKNVKPGGVIAVALAGKYSMQDKLSPLGGGDDKAAGPWLCCAMQVWNPGGDEAVSVLPDVRQPAVYFLPSETAPELAMIGQVQLAVLADGWGQAVQGKPMDLLFRLVQQVNTRLHDEAMEELARTRDPKTLTSLIDWAISPPDTSPFFRGYMFMPTAMILTAVGDHEGDVYGPLWKWLTDPQGHRGGSVAYELLPQILGEIDPDRAFRDFSGSKNFWWLGNVRTEQSLRFLLDLLLKQKDAKVAVIPALGRMIPQYETSDSRSQRNRDALSAIARPVLDRKSVV
jgi:hypothetical protein